MALAVENGLDGLSTSSTHLDLAEQVIIAATRSRFPAGNCCALWLTVDSGPGDRCRLPELVASFEDAHKCFAEEKSWLPAVAKVERRSTKKNRQHNFDFFLRVSLKPMPRLPLLLKALVKYTQKAGAERAPELGPLEEAWELSKTLGAWANAAAGTIMDRRLVRDSWLRLHRRKIPQSLL